MTDRLKNKIFIFFAAAVFAAGFLAVSRCGAAAVAAAAPDLSSASDSNQNQIDASDPQIDALNKKIAVYETELKKIGNDKRTLKTALVALDLRRDAIKAQIGVTNRRIGIVQAQIRELGGEISNKEQKISENQKTLGAYLRDLQKADDTPLLAQILSSSGLGGIWNDYRANVKMEAAIGDGVKLLQKQKSDLSDSRDASRQKQAALAQQRASLAAQQTSLAAAIKSKNRLLTETGARESVYQKLLAEAEAQLKSFSEFTKNAGGSNLLSNQTVCDSWGCYYNQRDSKWGSDALNGTRYNLASDGCLVASMAMMMTHYGYRDITPATINSNPDNFAAYYPAYLLYTISAGGVTAARKASVIDANLAAGNPVVIGMNVYGGKHFVVLTSGANSRYLMRDPYIANGNDINFSSRYSLNSVFSISKVVIVR